MQPPLKKSLVAGVLALAGVLAVVLGLTWAGRTVFGAGIGETCTDDFGTKPGHLCISHRARKACTVDSDCDRGWGCRPTEVTVSGDRRGFRFEKVKICFSPEAMAGVHAREAARALETKKDDVHRQVMVRCISRPPQLTQAQFSTGWAGLSDDERAQASVAVLADRVITLARAGR